MKMKIKEVLRRAGIMFTFTSAVLCFLAFVNIQIDMGILLFFTWAFVMAGFVALKFIFTGSFWWQEEEDTRTAAEMIADELIEEEGI